MGRATQWSFIEKHQYVVGRAAMPAGEGGMGDHGSGGWDGCGSVTSALSLAGGQKATWKWPAVWETGSVAAKLRHSVRQAGVMSSPVQQLGMRAPAAVQPGHVP